MFDFDKLIKRIESVYYTEALMFLTELTLLIIAILNVRKSKIGRLFIFYILLDFLLLTANLILTTTKNITLEFKNEFIRFTNNFIALVELLVYFYFFKHVLPNTRISKLLKIFASFFLLILLTYVITKFAFLTDRLGYITNLIGATEFILLLPPCLLFFYNILNTDSDINLFERPSFWIVTGIFFYSFISIPFYLLKKHIDENYKDLLFTFNAALYIIPFTLNFGFLIKAFLCKKTLTI